MTPDNVTRILPRKSGFGLPLLIASAWIAVVLVKIFARNGGWAEIDATKFHFAIIDYFIVSGFDWNYPQVAPMYPGMHVFFALFARTLHLGTLVPTDWAAFAIQSIWGIAFIVAAFAIVMRLHRLAPHVERPLLLLILLCSSYPIASWIWPTTELGAYACLYGMIALTVGRTELSLAQSLLFTALVTIATLFRQNYALFAFAPLGIYGLAWMCGRTDLRVIRLAIQVLPVAMVAAVVLAFTLHWGGLIAPEMARVGMVSSFEFAQIENLIALIGLVGFPFVLLAFRSMAGSRAQQVGLAVVSCMLAVAIDTVAPLVYDRDHGHFGSLVWAVVDRQSALHLGHLPMIALYTLGLYSLLAIIRRCVLTRRIESELIFLGLMALSLLPQALVFQRYSEVAFLATLGIAFLRDVPTTGFVRYLMFGWFGAYALVSLIRPIAAITGLSG